MEYIKRDFAICVADYAADEPGGIYSDDVTHWMPLPEPPGTEGVELMSKCETCKWKTAEDGWVMCDQCAHDPALKDMYKPFTNAEHIRAMTDEELVEVEMLRSQNERLREANALTVKATTDRLCREWISVEERLPENNDKQVLVVVNGIYGGIHFHDAVEIAEFVWDEGWILEIWPEWENPDVTLWQPLPEPPSTEGVE